MKKSKLLIPFVPLAGLTSAITPMVFATSCSNPEEKIGESIPTKYLDITPTNVLVGLKGNADLSNCTKLIVPATVASIAPYAFWKNKLPAKVDTLIFETPKVSTTEDIPMSACAEIGQYAFYGTKIKNVQLTNGIRTIGAFAFSHSAVEHCNFPFTLQAIEEEAYSFSNIEEVAFSERRTSVGKRGVDVSNPFWFGGRGGDSPGRIMQENMPDGTTYYDYVSYVGERAFFNCQKLRYHRATNSTHKLSNYHYGTNGPYQQTTGKVIDPTSGKTIEVKYGPFACYDSSGWNIGQSTIRFLDWSLSWDFNNEEAFRSGDHAWPAETGPASAKNNQCWTDVFGFKVNGWEQPDDPRRFVICSDMSGLTQGESTYWQYMNMTFNSFGFRTDKESDEPLDAQTYLTQYGPTFNNAEFATNNFVGHSTGKATWPNSVWNFSIADHEVNKVELNASAASKTTNIQFRNFWENAKTTQTDDFYFPSDVKPIIKSVQWDGDKTGPEIRVQMDSTNPNQVNFTWEDDGNLAGRTVTIELEVSTVEAYRSWTYGVHPEDGYDDSIVITFA